jgi:hypothetical protein
VQCNWHPLPLLPHVWPCMLFSLLRLLLLAAVGFPVLEPDAAATIVLKPMPLPSTNHVTCRCPRGRLSRTLITLLLLLLLVTVGFHALHLMTQLLQTRMACRCS